MKNKGNEPVPLVNVFRSGVVECKHRGSIVIVENGVLVDYLGNPMTVTPMRSAAKPFQIVSLLEHNGIELFKLTLDEIAVMVSSHNGETRHVDTVRQLLNKVGLKESSLKCGTHPAYFPWITAKIFHEIGSDAQPIHNNCSGKHTGMLLLGTILNVPLAEYWQLEHPIQQTILGRIAQFLEKDKSYVSVGVDGCGVPTYNVNLTELAKMYSKFGVINPLDSSDKLGIVQKAMLSSPFMVAGSNRLDTDLMKLGSFIGKVGSEGIYCLFAIAKKIAIAIKIESGSEEACECVAVEMLRRLGLLANEDLQLLHRYWRRPIKTFTGKIVGEYQASF